MEYILTVKVNKKHRLLLLLQEFSVLRGNKVLNIESVEIYRIQKKAVFAANLVHRLVIVGKLGST